MLLYDSVGFLPAFLSNISGGKEVFAFAFADISESQGESVAYISDYMCDKESNAFCEFGSVTLSPQVTLSAIKKAAKYKKCFIVAHSHPSYLDYSHEIRTRFQIRKEAGFSEQDWLFNQSVIRVYTQVAPPSEVLPVCFLVVDNFYYQAVSWTGQFYENITIPNIQLISNPHCEGVNRCE